MLDPYTKKKFTTSIYKDKKFQDEAYDYNQNFSVHLPVEEDKYLQKLQSMSKQSESNRKKKNVDTQVKQQDLEGQELSKRSQPYSVSKECKKSKQQKERLQETKVRAQTAQVGRQRGRYGKTMSNKTRELGPWYYEKYCVTKGMNTHFNSKLKKTLYFDERTRSMPKTMIKNKIIDAILEDENLVLKNHLLREHLMQLKQMNLIKKKKIVVAKHPGQKSRKYVYNDKHSKITNPGYDRSLGGNFFN